MNKSFLEILALFAGKPGKKGGGGCRVLIMLLLIVAVIALAFVPVISMAADLQDGLPQPGTVWGTFTNLPSYIEAGGTSNTTSYIGWRAGKDLTLWPYFNRTNAGTSNLVFTFTVSYDGTNFATTPTFSITNSGNGTTAVRGYHILGPNALANAWKTGPGVKLLKLSSIASGDSAYTVWVTNLAYSWSSP